VKLINYLGGTMQFLLLHCAFLQSNTYIMHNLIIINLWIHVQLSN